MKFSALPTIETARLTLRAVRLSDVDDIFSFTSNPQTSEWLTWYPHQNRADTTRFVDSVLEKYRLNKPAQWVICYKAESKVVGLCGFVDFSLDDAKGEVAYVVSPAYWGKGILPEALRAIIDFAFAEEGVVRIEAKCEVGNVGSERAAQKAGMILEGQCRKYAKRKGMHRDYKLYAITQ